MGCNNTQDNTENCLRMVLFTHKDTEDEYGSFSEKDYDVEYRYTH